MNREERRALDKAARKAAQQGGVDLAAHATKPPSISMVYCAPRSPGLIHDDFSWSYWGAVIRSESIGVGIRPFKVRVNGLLARARNSLLEQFVNFGDDYVLFVDSDIVFNVQDIKALLDYDLPIVGGAYFTLATAPDGGEEPVLVALREDAQNPGAYQPLPAGEATDEEGNPLAEAIEVDGLGMGFTLIKREVIEALAPIKRLWPFADTDEERGYGEDLTFCIRAKEAGFQPYLAPSVRVAHIKEVAL